MKRAIWSVAPFGDFSFRSAHHGQLVLGLDTADYSSLREALQKEFRGKGLIAIDGIEEFVAAETDFHIAQLRKHGLVPLETSGALHVESSPKKARSYPPGTKIRFL